MTAPIMTIKMENENTNEVTPEMRQEWRDGLIMQGCITPETDRERKLWREYNGAEYTGEKDLKHDWIL